ncbi:uncharacterized protein EMH_0036470 [Eimeria mitis]|uniref:Uncharacterized protein n=1 Tax=Eimeria mitis TaxID=44415 RepID=U6K0L8_9EIME|nr:uncharacterized protein EMH_0036470 [Eimeria mitis]CDJ31290.1 hypothetical protein, conserved [Eimeria mitis]
MEPRRLSDKGGQRPPAPPGSMPNLSSAEDLQQHVEWAQRILDDRTLVPVQHKKVVEKPHSVLHLLWGAALVLLIIFVRRLPRFPGVVVPDRLDQGDPLLYWESKNIIGDNPEEGMQLRLRNNPHVAKGFHEFAQLSKESFDRRDKASQRIHNFQKQMVAAFNPLIVITDRMNNLLKQLPPLAESFPSNAEDLRAQLQHLCETEAAASDKKDEFLEDWNVNRMRKELYSDPMVATALRNLVDIDSAYMHKKIAMLEFLVSEAMKATEGTSMSPIVMKEIQFLESKYKAAASEAERQAAACMNLLPPQDHWLLLLFVEHLAAAPPPSPAPAPQTTN